MATRITRPGTDRHRNGGHAAPADRFQAGFDAELAALLPDAAMRLLATLPGVGTRPDHAVLPALLLPPDATERRRMSDVTLAAVRRLQRQLEPDHADQPRQLRAAGRRAATRHARQTLLRLGTTVLARASIVAGYGETLTEADAAWLTVLLLDLGVRGHAWAACDGHAGQGYLWTQVAGRAVSRFAAIPACLPAHDAAQSDDTVTVTRILAWAATGDPQYRLVSLAGEVLATGLPPQQWQPPAVPGAD